MLDRFTAWMAQHGITLEIVLGTIGILVAGAVVIFVINRLLHRLMTRMELHLRLPYETVLLITRALTGVLWLCLFLLILNFWGVSVAGIWALMVSAATVIGVGFLAVWTMVSNVTASFFITLWRPFRLGQTVELLPENLKGRVVERNMMFTALRESGGAVLQVPNNLFFQKIFRVAEGSQYLFEALEQGGVASEPAELRSARERAGAGASGGRPYS